MFLFSSFQSRRGVIRGRRRGHWKSGYSGAYPYHLPFSEVNFSLPSALSPGCPNIVALLAEDEGSQGVSPDQTRAEDRQ